MRLAIHHRTVYRYSEPATHSIQYLRLIPRRDNRQRVVAWHLGVPAHTSECVDAYGNTVRVLVMDRFHDEIAIDVDGVVDTRGHTDDPRENESSLNPLVFLRETPLTTADATLQEFARSFASLVSSDIPSGLADLMNGIRRVVRYEQGSTDVQTAASAVFAQGAGVCQDHSHVFIACCRVLGVPARYVSGYLYSERDSALQAASHAWAEAWVDRLGWLSFDVANSGATDIAHLRLAVGRDYLDACPIRGVRFGGGSEAMDVHVRVMTSQQ
jgi:transglutaminase-like putative cysteine protease